MDSICTLFDQHIPCCGLISCRVAMWSCSGAVSATQHPWAYFNFSCAAISPACLQKHKYKLWNERGSVFLICCIVAEVLGTEGWISDANYSVKHVGTLAGSPGLWVCTEDARFHNMQNISSAVIPKRLRHAAAL